MVLVLPSSMFLLDYVFHNVLILLVFIFGDTRPQHTLAFTPNSPLAKTSCFDYYEHQAINY